MSSHSHPHGELANENVHHEESDINVRAILTFVVVLTGVAVAIQIAMYGMFALFNKSEDRAQPTVSPLVAAPARVGDFPSPSLQTTPWTDLKKLRSDENAYLHSYGWVDESAGVARIPIDQAKALLLRKGLPVRADAVTDASEGTHVAAMGESNSGRNLPAGRADTSSAASAAPSTGTAPVPTPAGAPGSSAPPQTGQPASGAAAKKPGGGM